MIRKIDSQIGKFLVTFCLAWCLGVGFFDNLWNDFGIWESQEVIENFKLFCHFMIFHVCFFEICSPNFTAIYFSKKRHCQGTAKVVVVKIVSRKFCVIFVGKASQEIFEKMAVSPLAGPVVFVGPTWKETSAKKPPMFDMVLQTPSVTAFTWPKFSTHTKELTIIQN